MSLYEPEEKPSFDYCVKCGKGGLLILCDGCPRAFHQRCANLNDIPVGDYFCDYCLAGVAPDAPVEMDLQPKKENNLKSKLRASTIAASLSVKKVEKKAGKSKNRSKNKKGKKSKKEDCSEDSFDELAYIFASDSDVDNNDGKKKERDKDFNYNEEVKKEGEDEEDLTKMIGVDEKEEEEKNCSENEEEEDKSLSKKSVRKRNTMVKAKRPRSIASSSSLSKLAPPMVKKPDVKRLLYESGHVRRIRRKKRLVRNGINRIPIRVKAVVRKNRGVVRWKKEFASILLEERKKKEDIDAGKEDIIPDEHVYIDTF